MNLRYFLYKRGRVGPVDAGDQCVRQVQGHVDRFVIDVRSLNGVSPDAIKNLIEQRHEVTKIVHEGADVTVS